jgi:hypothetical protein
MRLHDEDFGRLTKMEELHSYFQELSPDEMLMELLRLESPQSREKLKVLNQFMAIYRSLSDVCANDKTIDESQRSYFITVANGVRETLEITLLPCLSPLQEDILLAGLISTDYNLAAFGAYPRAVDMLLTQARLPKGPYELSPEPRSAA